MLWTIFGAMLLAAVTMVAWPLLRHEKAAPVPAGLAVVVVVAGSAALYAYIGAPNADTVAAQSGGPSGSVASVEQMVASLDARLQENPNDVNGWKMLGRSYMELGDLPRAISAFEKAVALENGNNGETLISLGEAVLSNDRSSIDGRAGELFESGLALAPSSPRGLFYGGFSAIQRGDRALAADRWEMLLAQGPPPEIRDVLELRIAEWRGQPLPQTGSSAAPPAAPRSQAVVNVDISLSDAAGEVVGSNSSVFVIARDPAQPSPPIAVARRTVADLPATVGISDTDAMIRGRVPSAYEELEVIVRVSRSGQPIAQPGDWFGQQLVRPAESASASIVVDQQVR